MSYFCATRSTKITQTLKTTKMTQELITSRSLTKSEYSMLLSDLEKLIIDEVGKIKKQAANQMTLIYWQIGMRIAKEKIAQNSNYQSSILSDLNNDLGLERTTLARCLSFFEKYQEGPSQLSWSHHKYLIGIKNEDLRKTLQREAIKENLTAAGLATRIKNINQNQARKIQKIKRPTAPTYLYKAKVLDVVDGDTLILDVDLGFTTHKEQRIRLAQIDCPEIRSEAGEKAFYFVRDKMVDVDFVVVKTNKIDIFGRYIGDIFYDLTGNLKLDEIFLQGTYLNEEIVKNGFAKII
ncbi:MAG: micrococcal nuclease [Rickettsiales bacterium]|jgi:micrococcal nuclease